MGRTPNYIPTDGYTIDAYIAPTDLHDEFRFSYRPMSNEQQITFNTNINRKKEGIEQERYGAGEIASKYLVKWDLTDGNGNEVPIMAKTIMENLNPQIWQKIYLIIRGALAADVDPSVEKTEVFQEEAELKN